MLSNIENFLNSEKKKPVLLKRRSSPVEQSQKPPQEADPDVQQRTSCEILLQISELD